MTIEDWALQFEGIDPAKVDAALADAQHLLGVMKTVMPAVQGLVAAVAAELPRIEKLITEIQSQIAAYEANQRRFR